MLEHTYEGRVDARIITEDIRGTRTGVFTTMYFSDSEIYLLYRKFHVRELEM